MPPKRRSTRVAPTPKAKHKRASALARENDLTADQEDEIREAFSLFAVQHPDHEDSEEGVLKRDDVRRCLMSLNLGPDKKELPSILSTIDPLNTGFVPFVPFLSYAALALHSKHAGSEEEDADDSDEYNDSLHQRSDPAEVRAAYSLFTHGTSGPITLAHLKRVAKELREDVSDDVLRDMIAEANGGVKGKGKGTVGGVTIEEFEGVMRRAGVSFG